MHSGKPIEKPIEEAKWVKHFYAFQDLVDRGKDVAFLETAYLPPIHEALEEGSLYCRAKEIKELLRALYWFLQNGSEEAKELATPYYEELYEILRAITIQKNENNREEAFIESEEERTKTFIKDLLSVMGTNALSEEEEDLFLEAAQAVMWSCKNRTDEEHFQKTIIPLLKATKNRKPDIYVKSLVALFVTYGSSEHVRSMAAKYSGGFSHSTESSSPQVDKFGQERPAESPPTPQLAAKISNLLANQGLDWERITETKQEVASKVEPPKILSWPEMVDHFKTLGPDDAIAYLRNQIIPESVFKDQPNGITGKQMVLNWFSKNGDPKTRKIAKEALREIPKRRVIDWSEELAKKRDSDLRIIQENGKELHYLRTEVTGLLEEALTSAAAVKEIKSRLEWFQENGKTPLARKIAGIKLKALEQDEAKTPKEKVSDKKTGTDFSNEHSGKTLSEIEEKHLQEEMPSYSTAAPPPPPPFRVSLMMGYSVSIICLHSRIPTSFLDESEFNI